MDINKIHKMDCMEGMKNIPDKSIDLILTDPPYGITALEWDKKPNLDKLWKEYNRIIKDNGAIVLTATCKFGYELIKSNFKYFRYDLVWKKSKCIGFPNAKRMPLRNHELVLVFYKKLPTYNPQELIKIDSPKEVKIRKNKHGVYRKDTFGTYYTPEYENYPKSVLEFPNGNNKNIHPTQKPLDLFKYLILTYSNKGDLVLDNYMGSGTTAVACIETGRNYIGFESNEGYYKKCIERVNECEKVNR